MKERGKKLLTIQVKLYFKFDFEFINTFNCNIFFHASYGSFIWNRIHILVAEKEIRKI